MSESASATITATQLDPADWQYSVTLDDTGSTTVGTFWFAWIPGEDFLATQPANISDPTGWMHIVTNGGPSDGFAIQWTTTSAEVQSGTTLGGFTFDSTDAPSAVFGDSVFHPGAPVLTSFVYSGAPFSDPGFEFQVTPACFVAGTFIRTERGMVAVEALREGDRVPVAIGGGSKPIVWLGHRRVDCKHHPKPTDVWPVCLEAGAFGPGRPFRDLWLSPDHALFVNGVLIPIRHLVNGKTIRQETCDEVTYWHVELAEHNVLYAEGVPTESYLDTGNRSAFVNGGTTMDLHADFARRIWETESGAPLVLSGPKLVQAKRRLHERLRALGHRTTDEPALKVLVNDRETIAQTKARTMHVRLPIGTKTVRLVSRSWIPAHMEPDSEDARSLGIAVSRVWLDGKEIGLDGPQYLRGWHAAEEGWRWTNGDACIATSAAHELAFEVMMTGIYWHEARACGEVRAA